MSSAAGAAPLLCARGLCLPFAAHTARGGADAPLNFTLGAGQGLSFCGPSGAGKSSLLLLLALWQRSAPGQLFLSAGANAAGDDAAMLPERVRTRLRRGWVASVLQRGNLVPELSVADNVTLPDTLRGRRARPAPCAAALGALGLLPRARRLASQLSAGEAARAATARILYQRPALAVLDEPTAALDAQARRWVQAALVALRQAGTAVVVATHDAELAGALGDTLWLGDKEAGGLPC